MIVCKSLRLFACISLDALATNLRRRISPIELRNASPRFELDPLYSLGSLKKLTDTSGSTCLSLCEAPFPLVPSSFVFPVASFGEGQRRYFSRPSLTAAPLSISTSLRRPLIAVARIRQREGFEFITRMAERYFNRCFCVLNASNVSATVVFTASEIKVVPRFPPAMMS